MPCKTTILVNAKPKFYIMRMTPLDNSIDHLKTSVGNDHFIYMPIYGALVQQYFIWVSQGVLGRQIATVYMVVSMF